MTTRGPRRGPRATSPGKTAGRGKAKRYANKAMRRGKSVKRPGRVAGRGKSVKRPGRGKSTRRFRPYSGKRGRGIVRNRRGKSGHRGFEGPLYRPWNWAVDKAMGLASDAASKAWDQAKAYLKKKILDQMVSKKTAPKISIDQIVKLNPSVDPGPMKKATNDELLNKLGKLLGEDQDKADSPDQNPRLTFEDDAKRTSRLGELVGEMFKEIDTKAQQLFNLARNNVKDGTWTQAKAASWLKARLNQLAQYTEKKWKPILDAAKGGAPTGKFADSGKLAQHFKDHGADFGAKSAEQYQKMADTFLNGPRGAGVLQKVRPNGDIVRYDPATEAYGVVTPDGTIRTYFKPDPKEHGLRTNLDYFNDR
jgi:hypothetical protein